MERPPRRSARKGKPYNYVSNQILEIAAKSLFTIPTSFSIMSSILKAQKANASKSDLKGKRKRREDEMDVDEDEDIGGNVPVAKKKKNKQRVLLLSSRGITHRMRHLMNDLEALLPHVKKGAYFAKPRIMSIYSFGISRLETRFKITTEPDPRARGPE